MRTEIRALTIMPLLLAIASGCDHATNPSARKKSEPTSVQPASPPPVAQKDSDAAPPRASVKPEPVEAGIGVKPSQASSSPAVDPVATADPLSPPGPDYHWIRPYTRLDGTPVAGLWKKNPPKSTTRHATKAEPVPRVVEPAVPSVGDDTSTAGKIWVEGYTRKDGTKVKGYWRRK